MLPNCITRGLCCAGLQLPVHQLHGAHRGAVLREETTSILTQYRVEKQQVYGHRRRIYREEKAKVVTAVWGTELFNSLPR